MTARYGGSWNGTSLEIDTSSYNSDPTNQLLWVQKFSGGVFVDNITNMSSVGSYLTTFKKEASFDGTTILLWGNSGHGSGIIDVSSLTNGTTYTLKFDVTEYGNYTATITNIGIYEQ